MMEFPVGRRRRAVSRRGLVCGAMLAGAVLSGCYSYVPVRVDAVRPGESVRARLSEDALARLPGAVREQGRRDVEGEVLDRDPQVLLLSVPAAARQQGFYVENLHERLRLGLGDVVEVERRQLDRSRTVLLVGAGASAVAAVALQTLSGSTGGNTIDRTNPGPSADRIPLLVLRIR